MNPRSAAAALRRRLPPAWVVAAVAGLLVVVTGFLAGSAAREVISRTAPVLVFLVAITVVAALADRAGVFTAWAGWAARVAHGRTVLLWAVIVALAVVITVVLSLDTTAVLLTPVVLTLSRHLRLRPVVFAVTALWLANTASLLLPVSNLTNLLALHRLAGMGVGLGGYLELLWAPALVAVVGTVLVLGLFFRRDLAGRYQVPPRRPAPDPVLFRITVVVVAALVPAFLTGVPVAWPASVGAVLLLAAFAWRRRSDLHWSMVPWRTVLMVSGLFLVVEAIARNGVGDWLTGLAGVGESWPALVRLAGVGALAANGVNNLPAYLALEPAADSPIRLAALLIGVNVGPLLTLWASLATVLWRHRCEAAGVTLPWRGVLGRGLVLVPVLLVGCTATLVLASG
ncbi:ArsB/NhaD family transporter [Nakamurella leprariae]|uniref:Citrate transporter-like domain-containing protein n=1 Tax=Nakamurella leprariae TaxID=2803911 RepID=A0A938YF20_9ACTN|nr:SLC13 family permease [Nakamurella leprariae]MBM9468403.1 hypothetical protein [Nakamurella leprariae]